MEDAPIKGVMVELPDDWAVPENPRWKKTNADHYFQIV